MELTIADLKVYLAQHMQKYPLGDFTSLLESLFWEYLDGNYVSTDIIREQSRQAEKQMERLSVDEVDAIFNCFHLMCAEFQHLAFVAGAQAGARITLELLESRGDS